LNCIKNIILDKEALQMMNSVSSSDFTLSSQLLENGNRRETNMCDNDLLHIYILSATFLLSIVGFLVYIFIFA
jgi:hypothetical protein